MERPPAKVRKTGAFLVAQALSTTVFIAFLVPQALSTTVFIAFWAPQASSRGSKGPGGSQGPKSAQTR